MNIEKIYNFYPVFGISLIIVLFNLLTIGSPVGIVITVVQYAIVGYLLIRKFYSTALFWHFFFICTGISLVSISGMDGGETMRLYNYASIKFIGPISLCYILSIVFFIIAFLVDDKN